MNKALIEMVKDTLRPMFRHDYSSLAATAITGRKMLMELGVSREEAEKIIFELDKVAREVVSIAANEQFD